MTAATAQHALFDFARSMGCADDELMKLAPDSVSWRGAVYRAVPESDREGTSAKRRG